MTQTKGHTRVNLHLDPKVHERLKEWCKRNGKTLQDGLALIVDLSTRPDGLRLARAAPAPIDMSGLFGHRAPPSQPPTPTPVQSSAVPRGARAPIRVCHKCFGTSPGDALACVECGTVLSVDVPSPSEEETGDDASGWDGLIGEGPSAAPPASTAVLASDPVLADRPVRYTPATHEIPVGWVNEYGLTVQQQNVIGPEEGLEYRPSRADWVAH